MHDDYKAALDDWIAMLSISTRLIFPKVRARATKELTSRLDEIEPFDLIGLAVKCDVQEWLKPAYRRIVIRANLIAHEEAEKIPILMTTMLMRSREQYWKRDYVHGLVLVDRLIDSEVELMDQVSSESATARRAA
ncbi:hypothetical protein EI94DRAFT_1795059 [Lactarius quietus]|nr:hypothetical protein EI94DRAFT_1795059 [Lactarius quietus]